VTLHRRTALVEIRRAARTGDTTGFALGQLPTASPCANRTALPPARLPTASPCANSTPVLNPPTPVMFGQADTTISHRPPFCSLTDTARPAGAPRLSAELDHSPRRVTPAHLHLPDFPPEQDSLPPPRLVDEDHVGPGADPKRAEASQPE